MKTIPTLAAAAVLGLGLSAHAGEPLKLDDATLDTITAGAVANGNVFAYRAVAGTFPAFVGTSLGGQGSFSMQSTANSKRTTTPSSDTLKLNAAATGIASGSGLDIFVSGGGFVLLQFGQIGNGPNNEL